MQPLTRETIHTEEQLRTWGRKAMRACSWKSLVHRTIGPVGRPTGRKTPLFTPNHPPYRILALSGFASLLIAALTPSVISSSGATSAYATDILAIMDLYFHTTLGAVSSIVLLLTTQCIGFGLAGMVHNFLVSPPAMYWPSTLVTVQLFTTLYPSSSSSTSSPSTSASAAAATSRRLRIFLLIFLAVFTYQFLPFLLFPTLTSVSLLCLIDNRSYWLRTLGSAYDGLGMLDFSFDWSSIGTAGPLYTPFWALGNYFGGLVGMVWGVVPLMLAFNFW